jgi:hypothetical protein
MSSRRCVHNVHCSAPRAGTSMLARRLATILPEMTLAEAIETTRIPRVAALTDGWPWRDAREVLNGLLRVLRTGAQGKALPDRSPPYQTCHRRSQQWARSGVFAQILAASAAALGEHSDLDLSECPLDGTLVVAKQEAPSGDDHVGQGYEDHGHDTPCWSSYGRPR